MSRCVFRIVWAAPTLQVESCEIRRLLCSSIRKVTSGQRAAITYFLCRLLGARPCNLPIQQPTRFKVVINGNTAHVLGNEDHAADES